MNMAAVVLSALLLFRQGADDKKVGDLIRDLGADEYSARERAESELRKMGSAAIPALKGALEDKDPERALRAERLLGELEKKHDGSPGEPRPRSRTWTAYRDFGRGITFETHPDGKVELTVREAAPDGAKKETHTYRADSLEDFKKKYPELMAKYDLDNVVPKQKWDFSGDPGEDWDPWKKRFDPNWLWEKNTFGKFALPWFPFNSGSLEGWMEEQKKLVEEFRKLEPLARGAARREEAGKPQLGISVERPASALVDQLGLGPQEGLVVAEVRPGSPAERAGLKKYDVLVKVNGKPLAGPEDLRQDVEVGLKNGMELEVLRHGKRETIKVEPAAEAPK